MKVILCLLACGLAQAFHPAVQTADKSFLVRQKSIYELFWHVDQPTVYHPELYQKARSFSLLDNVTNFDDRVALNELLEMLKHGMLPRGQVFSIFHPDVHHEAVVLFRVLYSAKDFDTFYNTAVWARFHVNEQMYVYALSVAVIQRPDMKNIKLPPLYEMLPNFFYNEDVLHQAYLIAMGDVGVKKTVSGIEHHVIQANYSGGYMHRHNVPEQKLSYFLEDVGLNSYYFMVNHDFPYFMNSDEFKLPKHVRGELYLYGHKQLVVRYYLERLSNNMGEIEHVDIDRPLANGFYPDMHYHNGLPIPRRDVDAVVPLHVHAHVQHLKDLHTRISVAIDLGFVVDSHGQQVNIYTPEGLDILGSVIQGNADSVNQIFYGHMDILARRILGFGFEGHQKYQFVPGALEVFCTSMRDPIFYGIHKNIVTYLHQYKQNVPKYTRNELLFPGVEIESVTVDKLLTFFEQFETMINNAVSIRSHKEAQSTLIKTKQYRLNHKPFTYHISVNSDKNTKAMLRVFLGPKFDVYGQEVDMLKNYMNFLEIDQWIVDLKTGVNKIERSSHESIFVVPDEIPSEQFYKKVLKAIEGTETYTYSPQLYGFPERLILPKGKKEGMPFKLFVFASQFDESTTFKMDSPIWGPSTVDGRSMGFPLDRPILAHHVLEVPNAFIKDVLIFHKQMEELNVTV